VLLARELDLVSGTLVAIEGAFFHGDASKASITTRKKLLAQLAALDRDIEAYGGALDANDAAEARGSGGGDDRGGGGDIALKVAALMAKRAQAQVDLDAPALADVGYYNGATLKACEEDGIVAYVPQAKRTGRLQAQGRFCHEDFAYDAAADAYRCPAGALLPPTKGRKINTGGRIEIRYVSRKASCDACPLRRRCVTEKAPTRTVYRWEHEAVIERHRERMQDADALMRRRAGLAEHPFGTLKCRAGYRHFLLRGLHKVRGEWSLMALCYNFMRVLKIIGFDGFTAYLARIAEQMILRLPRAAAVRRRVRTLLATLCEEIAEKPIIIRLRFNPAK
jgi:Transposase DDE domain